MPRSLSPKAHILGTVTTQPCTQREALDGRATIRALLSDRCLRADTHHPVRTLQGLEDAGSPAGDALQLETVAGRSQANQMSIPREMIRNVGDHAGPARRSRLGRRERLKPRIETLEAAPELNRAGDGLGYHVATPTDSGQLALRSPEMESCGYDQQRGTRREEASTRSASPVTALSSHRLGHQVATGCPRRPSCGELIGAQLALVSFEDREGAGRGDLPHFVGRVAHSDQPWPADLNFGETADDGMDRR